MAVTGIDVEDGVLCLFLPAISDCNEMAELPD
jgi:hypothetical protein